jgi:hypothetical protein
MAMRYSPNAQNNNSLNSAILAPSINRKSVLEQSILATVAIHGLLENVSVDFVKVKVQQEGEADEKNSLGSYFIEGLMLLGMYKKAVFMVNPE